MTFKTITDRIEQGNLSPNEVSEYRNFCAVWLFRLNTEYGALVSESAQWQVAKGDEFKSQAACERAWEATEKGQRQTALKYQIRGVEHIQDALETNWFLLNRELKEAGKI